MSMAIKTKTIYLWLVVVVLCVFATAGNASAETYTVRVVRDVPYLQGVNYADDKDKLDLYLPEGRPNASCRTTAIN